MRILHLTTFLQGGAGRVIVNLARQQQAAGHEVSVVTSRRGPRGYGNYQEYLDDLTAAGIVPHLVDSMFERNHAQNIGAVSALDQIFRPGREPQVIHSHAAIPSLVSLLFAGARRVPIALVQTMHGWGQVKTTDQVSTDVGLLNLLDRVVVPSSHSATLLCSLGVSPARVAVTPYGIAGDQPTLHEADHEAWVTMTRARRTGRLVAACVGTFCGRKNQTMLVNALARVTDANVLVVFIGDGDDRDLRQRIAEHACEDRVIVHGYSRSARALASAADVLVLPSRSEGQPLSIIEAFCDGALVAVSDIPELVELVQDDATGFVFPLDDAAALAGTLTRIAHMSNSTRRAIRLAARARYTSHFTLPRMVDDYARIYQQMYDTRRAASEAARSSAA